MTKREERPTLGFVGIHAGSRTDRPPSQDETVAALFEGDGYRVRRTSSRRSRVTRTLDQIVSVATWRKVDVVMIAVFSWQSFWITDFASAICRLYRRRKVVLVLHGGELPVFAAAYPRWVRRVFARADRIIAPSAYLADEFSRWGFDVGVVPNVVPIERDGYGTRTRARPALLWMRAFHENYDPMLALEVIDRVAQVEPTVTLTMGGADHGLYDATIQRAASMGLDKRVHFAGYLDDTAKAAALAEHDLFLNTNLVDNMPISVIEAAACGLVPVATRVGGIPALLSDDRDSWLVDAGDADAMAQAVLALLAEPEHFARLSLGARSLAEQFSWDLIRPRWEAELDRLVPR